MFRKGFVLLFCVLGYMSVEARTGLTSNIERVEVNLGGGFTKYNGDIGSKFTHPGQSFNVGSRYYFSPRSAFKLNFSYMSLSGNDTYNSEFLDRGYSFNTPLTELASQMEFFLFKVSKNFGEIGYDRSFIRQYNIYVNYGFGYAFFNPTTTLPADIDQHYKRRELVLPVGLGLRLILNRSWNIDLEITKRITTTDFLDGYGVLTSSDDSYASFNVKLGYRLSRKY